MISVECLQASRSLRSHLWLHLLRLPGSNGRFWRAPCGPGPRGPPLLTVTVRCLKAPLFLCPSGIMSGRGVVWVVTLLLRSESVYFKCVRPRSNERARMMWWSLTDPLPTKGVKVISACIVGYAAPSHCSLCVRSPLKSTVMRGSEAAQCTRRPLAQ